MALLFCLTSLFSFQGWAQQKSDSEWDAFLKNWKERTKMMLAPGHDWKAVDQWEEDALLMEKYAFIGKTEAFHELFILAPRLDTDPGELLQAILLSLSKERPKAFKKALSKEDKRIQKSVKVLLDFTEAP